MKTPRIAIIDYKMCNLFSVEHACRHLNADAFVTSSPEDVAAADAVVLPGVGAFKDAMDNLQTMGLVPEIRAAIRKGKPFLGICLGFQMLFTRSEEFGIHEGLDIFQGTVRAFPAAVGGKKIKVPHMGWSRISKAGSVDILSEVSDHDYMYFVHSFYVEPDDKSIIATTSEYEEFEFCSSVASESVYACQFHPEKSGDQGIKLLESWIRKIQ